MTISDDDATDAMAPARNEKTVPQAGSPEARRARAMREAREEAARRRTAREASPDLPPEVDGRGGEEPTRFGDWEVKGIASDF